MMPDGVREQAASPRAAVSPALPVAGQRASLGAAARARRRGRRWVGVALRGAYTVAALFLFVLALEVLKGSASGLGDLLDGVSARGSPNILGLGWLGSYLMMSGSPVAAIALSLFAGGVISDAEGLAMLNGSRLGASFIVLFAGFLYYLGRRRTADGIFIGVVALLTTFSIYAAVVPVGSFVLEQGWFDRVELATPGPLVRFTGFAFRPGVERAAEALPGLLLFAGGAGLLLSSFALFDRALPNLEQPSLRVERISRWLHHPFAMFALGLVVTAVTLSVSISLTLLIPLSLKGYVRRDGIIPYVMGANISTWVDTMVAAVLLDSPRAFTIVFTQMTVGAAISLMVLLLAYRPYSRGVLAVAHRVTQSRRGFALFLGSILLVPLALFFS